MQSTNRPTPADIERARSMMRRIISMGPNAFRPAYAQACAASALGFLSDTASPCGCGPTEYCDGCTL